MAINDHVLNVISFPMFELECGAQKSRLVCCHSL